MKRSIAIISITLAIAGCGPMAGDLPSLEPPRLGYVVDESRGPWIEHYAAFELLERGTVLVADGLLGRRTRGISVARLFLDGRPIARNQLLAAVGRGQPCRAELHTDIEGRVQEARFFTR